MFRESTAFFQKFNYFCFVILNYDYVNIFKFFNLQVWQPAANN